MNRLYTKTLIIHSKVSYGYVGSNTTSLILQLGGADVLTVPTVLYSNHLGYPTVGGGVVPEILFKGLLEGILKLNIQNEISTIITGFMGSVAQVSATAEFVRALQKRNPEIRYLCDPVMGDTDKGLYVQPEIPEAIIQELVPLSDILTPNLFEFRLIEDKNVTSYNEIKTIFRESTAFYNQKFLITGCRFSGENSSKIETIIAHNGEVRSFLSKAIPLNPPGTGELFTAHLQWSLLKGIALNEAVAHAAFVVQEVLARMLSENRKEFSLSDMQHSMEIN